MERRQPSQPRAVVGCGQDAPLRTRPLPEARAPAAEPALDEGVALPVADAPSVTRFDVPLPIDGLVDSHVQSRVEQVLRKLPKEGPRPTFVFEFRPKHNTAGEGNDFDRALSLARYLSGDRLAGVRTVAWLPRSVKGHAVLPVLACEQIIMQKDAELGAAGIDERGSIDALTRRGYSEIADRRKTVPTAVALGLLDKDLAVYKVNTPDGLRYELHDDLASSAQEGKVTSEETFFQPGDPHVLSGAQMRELGFATHLADDRRALAAALDVPVAALQQQARARRGLEAVADRSERAGPQAGGQFPAADDRRPRAAARFQPARAVVIRSGGGDLGQSRAAGRAPRDRWGRSIHTVAFVDAQARGDAALIATACDELVVHPDAMLGGPGETALGDDELTDVREPAAGIARAAGRDWSLPLALVDPQVQVFRATRTVGGEVRYLSAEELETLPDQRRVERDDSRCRPTDGITGQTAEELGLARAIVHNLDDAKALFQIEGELAAGPAQLGAGVRRVAGRSADRRRAAVRRLVRPDVRDVDAGRRRAGLHRGGLLPAVLLVAVPARHGRLARNPAVRRRHRVPGGRAVRAARHGHVRHRRRADDHRVDRAGQPDVRRADQRLSDCGSSRSRC